LRNALLAGEFELFYQPLVRLETETICGFEALLRWRSAPRGTVPPAEFIPLAEEIGIIVPLGEWVLRQACAEAAAWPGNLKVAVNLSPVQFKNGNLPQTVIVTLASKGLSAGRLELEITESVLLEESRTKLATLRQLRALGVGISMDDFGTGYSGMSYLRSFPFDKIKIARSFVSERVPGNHPGNHETRIKSRDSDDRRRRRNGSAT
jgi:EAL domain-containing protein (putative c-di-GMP-specific phosphodiesterase class I)